MSLITVLTALQNDNAVSVELITSIKKLGGSKYQCRYECEKLNINTTFNVTLTPDLTRVGRYDFNPLLHKS